MTLVYLYWSPENAHDLAPCAIHAAEVTAFVRGLGDPRVRILAMTYAELCQEWSAPSRPSWLRQHVSALRKRYAVKT